MALRDQPYLPLYIQDFLTDEKLNECCASSVGVYIKIMCLMHKHEHYGKILLKQKDKQVSKQIVMQNDEQVIFFALKLAKLLPFDFDTIYAALMELLDEKVLHLEDDYLVQHRMVEDNDISVKRSLTGKEGGESTQRKIKTKNQFALAKSKANSENESEDENENESLNKKGIDFFVFWDLYEKKVGDKEHIQPIWDNLSDSEQAAALEHIPNYKVSTPNKKYRKDPITYLLNKSFNDEVIYNSENGSMKKDSDNSFIPL